MRINKYLALKTNYSRREADKLIEAGRVSVNGKTATIGYSVSDNDAVEIDGKKIMQKSFVYLAYNKPTGIVSSSPHFGQKSIAQILLYPVKVHPVGRLDKDSSGLIILTNDPTLTEKLSDPKKRIEKEYEVLVNKSLTKDFIEKLKNGIFIETEKGKYKTKPARIKQLENKKFSIILTEGKKRQIRLMCQASDYNVLKLTRIRIGKLKLNKLPVGNFLEFDNLTKIV